MRPVPGEGWSPGRARAGSGVATPARAAAPAAHHRTAAAPPPARRPARAGPGDGPRLADLTTRAVHGQPAAIESLLEHIRPMVVRYCRARLGRITGHYHVADDVAQEVCIAVLSALPRYRDMGRPFASF